MRKWEGINADNSATAQGDAFASNTRLWIEGELRRRDGLIVGSITGKATAGCGGADFVGIWP